MPQFGPYDSRDLNFGLSSALQYARKAGLDQQNKQAQDEKDAQKIVLDTVLSLAKSGDPESLAGAQRFVRGGGDYGTFREIAPIDPQQATQRNDALEFGKLFLGQDQFDPARQILESAGIPGAEKIGIDPVSQSMINQRASSESLNASREALNATRESELKRYNDARIKKLDSDIKKNNEQIRNYKGKNFRNVADEYINRTKKVIDELQGLVQERGGVITVPQYAGEIDPMTGKRPINPQYQQVIGQIQALTDNINLVSDFMANQSGVVGQGLNFKQKKDDTIAFLQDRYGDRFDDSHIEKALNNPTVQKAVQEWKRRMSAGEPIAR